MSTIAYLAKLANELGPTHPFGNVPSWDTHMQKLPGLLGRRPVGTPGMFQKAKNWWNSPSTPHSAAEPSIWRGVANEGGRLVNQFANPASIGLHMADSPVSTGAGMAGVYGLHRAWQAGKRALGYTPKAAPASMLSGAANGLKSMKAPNAVAGGLNLGWAPVATAYDMYNGKSFGEAAKANFGQWTEPERREQQGLSYPMQVLNAWSPNNFYRNFSEMMPEDHSAALTHGNQIGAAIPAAVHQRYANLR